MYGNSLYYIYNFSVSPEAVREAVKIKYEKENLQVLSVTAASIGPIHMEMGMLQLSVSKYIRVNAMLLIAVSQRISILCFAVSRT